MPGHTCSLVLVHSFDRLIPRSKAIDIDIPLEEKHAEREWLVNNDLRCSHWPRMRRDTSLSWEQGGVFALRFPRDRTEIRTCSLSIDLADSGTVPVLDVYC